MTIHEITSQGSATIFGPVVVKKLWPYKQGDKSINGVFTDATGEANFKIWGATPANGIFEGCVLTLIGQGPKGKVINREYPEGSGKWALNASDCRVDIQGGASTGPVEPYVAPQAAYQAPAQQYSQPAAQAPQGAPAGQDKLPATMSRAAYATHLYVDALVLHGFTRDESIMLAVHAGAIYPLWWGGEKFMS